MPGRSLSVHVLGIRHHGPGSAASLLQALQGLEPDIVLIEGPPEGDGVAALAGHADMRPPVALLIYSQEQSEHERVAAYYPFADFSPEWNALRYALQHQIPTRFIDLPQTHQMAMDQEREPSPDPFAQLAEAAGFEDGERWWESLVEQRRGAEVFEGILEAMAAVRQGSEAATGREARREAWMRRCIRLARKQGYQRIVVVCGAWHAPTLVPENWPGVVQDDQLLKGLPKRKVEATWVPWTYDRLAYATGYGAGVDSPEYYHLVWQSHSSEVAVRWMVSAAQMLRAEHLPASPASAVEAVRLAETLAALRGQPMAGLDELMEAARAVYCSGVDTPMRLIQRKLVLGERLGKVPEEAPQVPLARDLTAQQKRLRLLPEAAHRDLDLDLRKSNDRERSRLLHRLNLLNLPWGELRDARGTGTFRESWRLQWRPEFALDLVQAARWGNTVLQACSAFTIQRAVECPELGALTSLAESVLLADLPEALQDILLQLQARASLSNDPAHLLDSLPPFARILRYPDVRQTDASMLQQVVGGLVERIAIGLPLACSSLDDEAAEEMARRLQPAHAALMTLNDEAWLATWRSTLLALANQEGLHGLLAGRSVWILLDVGFFDKEEASRRLGLALSRANRASQAGAWVEGFLRDNGELLVHTPELFQVLDSWVCGLSDERFHELLPLLRRTFSSFPPGVRHNLGIGLRHRPQARMPGQLNEERVAMVVPLLHRILGLS